MPRDYSVTLTAPDGQSFSYIAEKVPDDLTPDQVKSHLSQQYAQQGYAVTGVEPQSRGVIGEGMEVIKDLARGVAKIPESLAFGPDFSKDPKLAPYADALKTPQQRVAEVTKPLREQFLPVPQNDSKLRNLVRAGLEGIGSTGGVGVSTAPVRSLTSAFASGVGGEVGGEHFGVPGALLGGLAGGGLAQIPFKMKGNTQRIIKETTKDIPPAALEQAVTSMKQHHAEGFTTNLNQEMRDPTSLDDLAADLANSRFGGGVVGNLRAQPDQLQLQADMLTSQLPGQVRSPQSVANDMQAGATAHIQGLKDQRKELWNTTYQRALETLDTAKIPAIIEAQSDLAGLAKARKDLETRARTLQQQLQASQEGDAAAVAAANKNVQATLDAIKKLETFTLPRGQAVGNTGRLLDPSQRGASIDMDSINREVQANRLRQGQLPEVAPAKSSTTLDLESQLNALNKQLGTAKMAEGQGMARLNQAEAARQNIGKVPEGVVVSQANRLRTLAQKVQNTDLGRELENLAGSFYGADGKPITDANNLNEILKGVSAKLKNPGLNTPGVDAGGVKYLQQAINDTRMGFGEGSQPFREANDAYKNFTEGVIDPVKKSVIGRIAGRGALPDQEAAQARVFSVLDKGTLPKSQTSEIRTLGYALNRQDPTLFRDYFKTWFAQQVDKAFAPSGNRPPENPGKTLTQLLGPSEANQITAKSRGMQDALDVLVQGMGGGANDTKALVTGMKKFLSMSEVAAVRPGRVSAMPAHDLHNMAQDSGVATVLQTQAVTPGWAIGKRLRIALNANAYKKLGEMLSTPEGAQKFLELAKAPLGTRAAAAAYASLSASIGQSADPNSDRNNQH